MRTLLTALLLSLTACGGPDFQECDQDGDGYWRADNAECDGEDCNDDDIRVFPGAAEACDLIDSDCDGLLGPAEIEDRDGDGVPDCADCQPDQPGVPSEEPCP